MIVVTSFGRIPLRQFPWTTAEAETADLLDFHNAYAQALFDRAEGGIPDLSDVNADVFMRLLSRSTDVRPLPDTLGFGDFLILSEAIYRVNNLELLGKWAARMNTTGILAET